MISTRLLAISIAWVFISTPLTSAQDLSRSQDFSRYREFQLGMSLVTVARQAGIAPEGRVLHRRPELIQELMWLPPLGSSESGDSARRILFSCYGDQLFRIVVSYDRHRTEGLTAEDMIEALSAKYGLAPLPATDIRRSLARVSANSNKILAVWEDAQHSVTLFTSSDQSTYGLMVLSKTLEGLAQIAIIEAIRLDEQEAPQREVERQQRQTEGERADRETARRLNKATFRP